MFKFTTVYSCVRLRCSQDWCQINNGSLCVCADAWNAVSKVRTLILLLVEKKFGALGVYLLSGIPVVAIMETTAVSSCRGGNPWMALNVGILNASHVHCMKEACSSRRRGVLSSHTHTHTVLHWQIWLFITPVFVSVRTTVILLTPSSRPVLRSYWFSYIFWTFFSIVREYFVLLYNVLHVLKCFLYLCAYTTTFWPRKLAHSLLTCVWM